MTMHQISELAVDDVSGFRLMLDMFGREFDEVDTYSGKQPSNAYIEDLLGSETFFALVARKGDAVIGALAAYELKKFEQERGEMYIYDLAVDAASRRQGIATALIHALGAIAKERGSWVMFVQADPQDQAAVALYEKLGVREDVYHFDIIPK